MTHVSGQVSSPGEPERAGSAPLPGWVHRLVWTQKIPSPCLLVWGPHPLQQDQENRGRIRHLHLQAVLQSKISGFFKCISVIVYWLELNFSVFSFADSRNRYDGKCWWQRPSLWDLVPSEEVPGHVYTPGQLGWGQGSVDGYYWEDPVEAGPQKQRWVKKSNKKCPYST